MRARMHNFSNVFLKRFPNILDKHMKEQMSSVGFPADSIFQLSLYFLSGMRAPVRACA